MSEMTVKILLTFAMFSFVGWIMLLTFISMRYRQRRQQEQERAGATGHIVEYKAGTGRGGRIPVVEFSVMGQTYRLEANGRMNPDEHPVGEEVDVHYDAADPHRFHLGPETGIVPIGRGGLRFSLIWIAGSLVMTLVLAVFVGGADFDLRNARQYLRNPGKLFEKTEKEPAPLEEDGFLYTVQPPYSARLDGCTDSDRTSLNLPILIGGYAVQSIRNNAFSTLRYIETARIHGGIQSVPAGAFSGCLSLRDVKIDEGVKSIGMMAFTFCMSLKDGTLPATVNTIYDNAFPEACSAVFHVPKGSEAERFCLKKGYTVEYTEQKQ